MGAGHERRRLAEIFLFFAPAELEGHPVLPSRASEAPQARGPEGSTLGRGEEWMRRLSQVHIGPWRTCQVMKTCFSLFLIHKARHLQVASIWGYPGAHLSGPACG